jgi:GNAT superfamily N-acetyltransferase
VRIRLATAADLDGLPVIEASASLAFAGAPYLAGLSSVTPAEGWRGPLAAGTLWVVESGDDGVVGFLGAERVSGGAGLHILELDVARAHQGRGLGRALLDHVIAWARGEGMTFLSLTTFRGVRWNGPFYASLGFREVTDSPRLAGIVAEETAKGLPDRCGMVLGLV